MNVLEKAQTVKVESRYSEALPSDKGVNEEWKAFSIKGVTK